MQRFNNLPNLNGTSIDGRKQPKGAIANYITACLYTDR
jgi:hypothetical protein